MKPVTIYTKDYCGYCTSAKALLDRKGVAFEEIDVSGDPAAAREVAQRSGQRTVPQIWIGEHHVGGFTDLAALEASGELDRLLG